MFFVGAFSLSRTFGKNRRLRRQFLILSINRHAQGAAFGVEIAADQGNGPGPGPLPAVLYGRIPGQQRIRGIWTAIIDRHYRQVQGQITARRIVDLDPPQQDRRSRSAGHYHRPHRAHDRTRAGYVAPQDMSQHLASLLVTIIDRDRFVDQVVG